MALTDEFITANRRAQRRVKRSATATAARFDRTSGRIIISLGSGMELILSPKQIESFDADIYLPALLEGVFGSKKWMAAQLGSLGGQRTSTAKKRAARANGKLGGRPRKAVS